jgi:organic radical activating enzyme
MPNKNKPTEWVREVLDSRSETFCGAKWYNATIWLGNGMTASCHHPPPHRIDPEEVKKNFRALHNTEYKKLVRKEMQEGIQTRECEYCWKIENLKQDLVSDRYYKSKCYSEDNLAQAFDTDWREDIIPQRLEIAFDNNCNFACSYCNAGFSTTWAHDINKNGAYQDLNSDGWGAFAHNGGWAMPYGVKNEDNPYIEAFWKWWEAELQYHLTELRVTGGEPTMSKDFWKLVKWFRENTDSPAINMDFSFNSNLGIKQNRIDELIGLSYEMKNLGVFTSNEAVGAHAEYIRDGLIWPEWQD